MTVDTRVYRRAYEARYEMAMDYGSEEYIMAFNALFDTVADTTGVDFDDEPHHSYLLKATNAEAIDYAVKVALENS